MIRSSGQYERKCKKRDIVFCLGTGISVGLFIITSFFDLGRLSPLLYKKSVQVVSVCFLSRVIFS